ncbi:MAG: hypothetical protein ACREL6_08785, partial [Gemmatimonadales bacterium]
VVLAGVLFVTRGLRRRSAPRMIPVTWEQIPEYLERLLRRGYDAGFVAFTIPGEERFVSVTKYLRETGEGGLEFDFPRSAWSSRYYDPLRRLLEERGRKVEIVKTPEGPVEEYLRVDCGGDAADAAALVRLVLEDVFAYPPGSPLVAEQQQVAARAEMIDTE